ncbi:unnamed protein product [Rhizoctonia solani]|uniref:Uncharacterized protein n=1 Tax=Rhizoctonia solani TaxID=456999 RepID=A0A8H3DVP8_9AGAM|nr:unnamed protein product [Rhizoctonia solani]
MASIRVVPSQTILTPPRLPSYLEIYNLQPIVGKPTDQEVKSIHDAIRALNGIIHLYTVYDPNLAMQLSQHLFGAQMAVHQANHSTNLLPRSVYTPPALPSHIPCTLNQVIGTPSDDDLKAAQGALKSAENWAAMARTFDGDLNMRLSQHVFDLQFARYMHDLAQGESIGTEPPIVPGPVLSMGGVFDADPCVPNVQNQEPETIPAHPPEQFSEPPSVTVPQPVQGVRDAFDADPPAPNVQNEESESVPAPLPEQVSETLSGIAQLCKVMEETRDATRESKSVLENMNRMLMSIKRDQCTIYPKDARRIVQKDPLNRQGILASECGLPELHCSYNSFYGQFYISLGDDQIARYLRFFGAGANYIQEGEEPKLIAGKRDEASNVLAAQAGIS